MVTIDMRPERQSNLTHCAIVVGKDAYSSTDFARRCRRFLAIGAKPEFEADVAALRFPCKKDLI